MQYMNELMGGERQGGREGGRAGGREGGRLTEVKLPHKAIKLVVLEVVRQHLPGKLSRVLHDEGIAILCGGN